MVARIEKRQEGFTILLTQQMMDDLHLSEGSPVELRAIPADAEKQELTIEHVSPEEVLKIYEQSKANFGRAYEALAK